MRSHLTECQIFEFPRFTDHRGSLSVIEFHEFPHFEPKRFYYLYDLVDGARRGCHAHRTEGELMLALAGSFRVIADDGHSKKEFRLDRPDRGLYIPPLVWHELFGFAQGSVCAVLASERYNVEDYYTTYENFVEAARRSGS